MEFYKWADNTIIFIFSDYDLGEALQVAGRKSPDVRHTREETSVPAGLVGDEVLNKIGGPEI